MPLVAGAILTSCNDDGYWDKASLNDMGYEAGKTTYTFTVTEDGKQFESEETSLGTTFHITLIRPSSDGELTLPLEVAFDTNADSPALSVPAQAVFADGETATDVDVTITRELNPGETCTAFIAVDPSLFGITPVENPGDAPEAPEEPGEDATDEQKAAYEKAKAAYDAAMAEYEPKAAAYSVYVSRMSEYKLSCTVSVSKENAWVDYATGTYCYTLAFCDYDPETQTESPAYDEGLTLQNYSGDTTKFRILDWGLGSTFTFSYDPSVDGINVIVDYQSTGYYEEGYGMVYVADICDWTGSTNYGYSYYDEESSTFYFAAYYPIVPDSGSIQYSYGYGYETFTITDLAVKSRLNTEVKKAKRERALRPFTSAIAK